jgi:hypothetical protein
MYAIISFPQVRYQVQLANYNDTMLMRDLSIALQKAY